MKVARFVKQQVTPSGTIQKLYKINEPIQYEYMGEHDFETRTTNYVLICGVHVADNVAPQTYIFPSDKDGKIVDLTELPGSFQGAIDFERALKGMAVEIINYPGVN